MITDVAAHRIFLALIGFVFAFRVAFHLKARSWDRVKRADEGPGIKGMRVFLGLTMLGVLIAYMVAPGSLDWARVPLPNWLRLAGVGLAVVGTALLFWVNWALGANFSTELSIRKDHQLIQSGPYRWVRHPMYTVFFLMFAGFFLLTANWAVGVIPLVALLVVIVIRTPREERMLVEQFGAEYLRYMERTGRYLPKLS